MSITTISKSKANVISIEESNAIALSFPSQETLADGMPVKLNATGELEAVANDGSDFPIGIVTRGTKTHVYEGTATVLTGFKQVLTVTALAPVTVGGFGIFNDYDAATGVINYKSAAAGNIALGIFLGDAAAGESVQIGILKTPHTVA